MRSRKNRLEIESNAYVHSAASVLQSPSPGPGAGARRHAGESRQRVLLFGYRGDLGLEVYGQRAADGPLQRRRPASSGLRERARGEEASRWLDDNTTGGIGIGTEITVNDAQGEMYVEVTPSRFTRRGGQLPAQYSLLIYLEPRNGGDGSGGDGGDGSGGNGGDGSGGGARGKTVAMRYPGGGATPDEDGCWQTSNNCVSVTTEWTNSGNFRTRATNNCGGRIYMRFCHQAPGLSSKGDCGSGSVRTGGIHVWTTNSGHEPTGSYHYQWIGSEKLLSDAICALNVEGWTDDPDYP